MLAAFIGSLAVMVVIFILSRAEEGSLSRLLLVGIAINALCGALVGVLSWLSNDAQLMQRLFQRAGNGRFTGAGQPEMCIRDSPYCLQYQYLYCRLLRH